MIVAALPFTSNFGVWEETAEFRDTEDGDLIDFSIYPEIIMEVIDPFTRYTVLALTKSQGQLTTPAPGYISWYVPLGSMTRLLPQRYEVRMTVQIDDPQNMLPIMRSSISVIE